MIRLNDGTEMTGHARETGSGLYVYAFGVTLADVYALLSGPEKTAVLLSEEDGQQLTARGYNHLRAISEEMNGAMICAVMTK